MPVRASVGSRAAVIDRSLFPALQRVPAPAAAAHAASSRASSARATPKEAHRALIVCALWLHIGLIGATAVAAALVVLVGGDAAPLPPLGVAILGGSIAFLAWRRGRRVLEG
jgi:hypothetical protein